MGADRFVVIAMAYLIAVSGLLGGHSAAAEDAVYSITVEGGPDGNALGRLKAFYGRLLAELKVDDLGYANVGCDSCAKLSAAGPPISKLRFFMETDSARLGAFASSYHYVQENQPHELFKMTIDGVSPGAVCPTPLPANCRPRTICVQTSSCDKPYGGPCDPCT